MKERPIIFSDEMVRAILEGRKTQTRRVIKAPVLQNHPEYRWKFYKNTLANWRFDTDDYPNVCGGFKIKCPYGQPGDRLWVRETIKRNINQQGEFDNLSFYDADETMTVADVWPWKRDVLPSIYCPRGLSRINLLIKDIRVERVQDITEEDAEREGIDPEGYIPTIQFKKLWNSINEKRGYPWESNPWVWVVEFEVEYEK